MLAKISTAVEKAQNAQEAGTRDPGVQLIDRSMVHQPDGKKPEDLDAYDAICCSVWTSNMRKGVFYRVKVPEGLMGGDKFAVHFEDCEYDRVNMRFKQVFVNATVPQRDQMRNANFIGGCERGGSADEIIIQYIAEYDDLKTKEKVGRKIIQALRIKKENPLNGLKFLMTGTLCPLYCFYFNCAGGCCESMEDMQWCEEVPQGDQTKDAVKAEVWNRANCQGSGGGGADVGQQY